jgi:molybdenum cofactor biosynthesis protein B
MVVETHRSRAGNEPLGVALVTVSDSRTPETDSGGPLLRELSETAGHRVLSTEIVLDDLAAIRDAVERALASEGVDLILLTGGTGVSPRDVTVDAARPLFEKELPGFGELFRMLSFAEVGSAAMLSRATAGVARRRAIFLLPGSPAALALAMNRLILPEVAHLLSQTRRS